MQDNNTQPEISNAAYRYALGFYVLVGLFFFYLVHSAGTFVGQHVTAQSVTGFSVANPDFGKLNMGLSIGVAVLLTVVVFTIRSLKDYVVEVGDELTRVSWSDLKQAQKSTGVVVVLVLVSAVFLFVADYVILKVINAVLGTAS